MNTLGQNRIKFNWLPYVLIAPIVIWIGFTIFIPLFGVIRQSLYNTGFVGSPGQFVGLENYIKTLSSDSYWKAWKNSLIWVFGNGFLQTVLAFAIALLLNKKTRITKLVKHWVIIPWVIPTIVVTIFWQWILNSSYGILNKFLLSINLIDKPINFIGHSDFSFLVTIFINTWHWFPFMAVIVLAGLSTIPYENYEAADVDGANAWQKFWKITFPSLGNITFALGLVGTLWSFNIFDSIYLLTEGGPAGKTTTVPVLIYQQAFESYKIGQASATSVVTAFFLIIFAFFFIKYVAPKDE